MYFAHNIKLLRSRKKASQEEASQALELPRSTYSGYENETAEPSLSTLVKIANYYNISLDKIVKTDLSKIADLSLKEIENGYDIDLTGNKLRVLATTVDSADQENIELVPESAKAGYTAGFADPDFIKVLPTFQLPFLSREKKYRTFPVSGDSMPPVIHGSYVTGEYVQNWLTVKSGFPYIIITKNDGIVFKIVYNKLKENNKLHLVSTNPFYEPYDMDVREVVEIWKFVNYISSELPKDEDQVDKLSATVFNLQNEIQKIKNVLKENKDN
ncbi:MAG TPA: helix-turn-helix domain-containing protein [Flavobacteriales bacterium]|nr:helix-turn-helix domain-containing protein [Flavobacteriales bacterium]